VTASTQPSTNPAIQQSAASNALAATASQPSNNPTIQSSLGVTNPPIQPSAWAASIQLSTNPSIQPSPASAGLNPQPPTTNTTNSQLSTLNSQLSPPLPSDKLAEYKRISGLLDSLEKKEQDLSLQFTPSSSLVKAVRDQIAENTNLKKQLEDENPALLAVKVAETRSTEPASGSRIDLVAETAKISALESRISTLTNQLEQIRLRAMSIDAKEGEITELQRTKEREEAQYKYFAGSLEQARIDEALSAVRDSNISKIQAPSPPFRDNGKLQKVQAMLLFGGIAGALALAFLLELYLDRTVKRPIEIEAKLGLPLFLSVPLLGVNGKPRLLNGIRKKVPLLARPQVEESSSVPSVASGQSSVAESEDLSVVSGQSSVVEPQDPSSIIHHPSSPPNGDLRPSTLHAPRSTLLHPFWDALRDRLITYFEVKNLTHKPKLVAVTSCGEGSGVTTVASGLAASLSETGDGNVLLVDMNSQHGAAHHFFKGSLAWDLDDALENGKRQNALVQDNLYVVSEPTNGDKLPRVLPKRFTNLIPKLKASDYDYIIFDMPPISQISATPRLARFMDIVLVVAESEKTDREVFHRATSLLTENKASVGVILNKRKTYVPKQLHQEL